MSSTTAVGDTVAGLTIRQVGCIADEACRIADEIGAPVRTASSTADPYRSQILLHLVDRTATAHLLIAELNLTHIEVHDTFSTASGQWAGVKVVVFGDLPTEAV